MTLNVSIQERLRRHEARFSIAPILPRCKFGWSTFLPQRSVAKSIQKATSDDEYAPKRKHIRVAILATYTHSLTSLSPTFIKSLTSITLDYTTPKYSFQTLGDIASPMGNSIYNSASTAGMSIRYHGLRAFKALIVLHSVLQEGPRQIVRWIRDSGELQYWLSSLIRDVQWCKGDTRGYGSLVASYAKYLLHMVKELVDLNFAFDLLPSNLPQERVSQHPFSMDERLPATSSEHHTIREGVIISNLETVSSDIQSLLQNEIGKGSISGCKKVALELVEKDNNEIHTFVKVECL